jgi:hypothetical protein
MLDCKQASKIISQSLDRNLTLRERFALKLHLLICAYCKRFSQQLQTMRIAIKQMTASIENDHKIEMPSAAKERVAGLIKAN